MVLEWKITCTCHQEKLEICCQTPLVAPIAPKVCTGGFFNKLNLNLPSDLLSDNSSNTSFNYFIPATPCIASTKFFIASFQLNTYRIDSSVYSGLKSNLNDDQMGKVEGTSVDL